MPLLLERRHLEMVHDVAALIDAVENAQLQHYLRRTVVPPRTALTIGGYEGALELMPAYLEEGEVLGVKALVVRPDNREAGLPTIHATVLLHEAESGRLLAILEGSFLTAARTAAASAVATRYLAREDSQVLAVLGTGSQARSHLVALRAVRSIRQVRVYSRSSERARAFKTEMETTAGLPIQETTTPEEALRDADVAVIATSSHVPLVSSEDLPAGLHVNSVGSPGPSGRELDTDTIRRAKVVVDSLEGAFEEAGEILLPLSEGAIEANHVYAELGELAAGAKPGRTSRGELTVYKSVGLAVQDLAAANLYYQRALRAGIGLKVDL